MGGKGAARGVDTLKLTLEASLAKGAGQDRLRLTSLSSLWGVEGRQALLVDHGLGLVAVCAARPLVEGEHGPIQVEGYDGVFGGGLEDVVQEVGRLGELAGSGP